MTIMINTSAWMFRHSVAISLSLLALAWTGWAILSLNAPAM